MGIQFQIIERVGCNLKKTLTDSMRTGSLETLIAEKGNAKLTGRTSQSRDEISSKPLQATPVSA